MTLFAVANQQAVTVTLGLELHGSAYEVGELLTTGVQVKST